MRAALTPDDVIDTALTLVERDGAAELTMRRLAGELGVSANTIYWHVGGRDELLDAVLKRVAARYRDVKITGRTPRTRVMNAARLIWRDALENYEVLALAHARGSTSSVALPFQLALAREVSASGLKGNRAALTTRGLLYAIGGFVVTAFARPDQAPAEKLWSEVEPVGLDRAFVEHMRQEPDLDATFEHTIGALVEALIPSS